MSSILTAVAVQFGPHFAKNIAPLKLYFSSDPDWAVNATSWGLFQSAVTLPCLIFPWLIGYAVDRNLPAHKALISALVFACIGQVIFIIATSDRLLDFALFGRFVFGIGEGLTSALPGYIAVRFTPEHKLLAIGLTQSFHALAVALSKASLAPIANYFESYIAALFMGLFMTIFSLAVCVKWGARGTRMPKPRFEQVCNSPGSVQRRICCQGSPGKLSLDFWLVAMMHLLFSSAHRLFGHVDAPFLGTKFGHSLAGAGLASSITEFVAVIIAPFLGNALDKYCTVHTLPIMLVIAACVGAFGYGLIAMIDQSAFGVEVSLVMIGTVNGIAPTVMRSVIPETVHESAIATAFGVYEATESVGLFIGSILVGFVAERAHDDYSSVVPAFSFLLVLAALLAVFLVVRRNATVTAFHKRDEPRHDLIPYVE